MKKNLNKLLAALLTLILLLSAVPALAGVKCPKCGGTKAYPIAGGFYTCPDCTLKFTVGGSGYLTLPMSGADESAGKITFVSTRRCLIVKGDYREYFAFRVEDGKLILTSAEGVETVLAPDAEGKGVLELALANGETFNADFTRATLSYIIHNGVFPIQK